MICDPSPSAESPSASGSSAATARGTERVAFMLAAIGAVMLASAGAVWGCLQLNRALFTENAAYNVRDVEVVNYDGLVARDEVLRQLELTPERLGVGVNLYAIDLVRQRQAFLRDHPGIRGFTLERYPPGRLVIDLQERVPLARIGWSSSLVVDEQGRVFTLPPARERLLDGLPVLISDGLAGKKAGDWILPADPEFAGVSVLLSTRRQKRQLAFTVGEIDLTGDVFLDLVTTDNLCIRLPYDEFSSEKRIGLMLRLASEVLARGGAAGKGSLEVLPGAKGRQSQVFAK